jgi:hypothetical protein
MAHVPPSRITILNINHLANDNIKEIVVPLIKPDLKFFEIEREFSRIYTMEIFYKLIKKD